MSKVKDLLRRLKHPQTILAIVGAAGLLCKQFGVDVDVDWLNNVAEVICYVLIILGVLNNPKNSGNYIPFVTPSTLPDVNSVLESTEESTKE